MFTLDQIQEVSKRVKTGADFPQFVKDLQAIGVIHYENMVADGKTTYYGANGFEVDDAPKYPAMPVNNTPSVSMLKEAISIHQQGQTDYPTFCSQAADAGVEKWVTHLMDLTVTYSDQQGKPIIVEPIVLL